MMLEIPLKTLAKKAEKRHMLFYDECVKAGTVENGVLKITVENYNHVKSMILTAPKQRSPPNTKATKCCGGKPQ